MGVSSALKQLSLGIVRQRNGSEMSFSIMYIQRSLKTPNTVHGQHTSCVHHRPDSQSLCSVS